MYCLLVLPIGLLYSLLALVDLLTIGVKLGMVPGPRPGSGQGAGVGTPWARGRGRDPLGQGPGGPGTKLQDAHGECNYLLSGKLPTVRQATYYQASYLLSGMHPNVAAYFAPKNRIHAPNRSIDLHPTTA